MNRKTISLAVAALLGGALISGCTHRKGAHRPSATPQLAKVETWNATPAGGAAAKPADDVTLSHWWSMLGDPILTSLEDRAVKANLDVRRAETKIRQAQSSRESARADLLPTYSVSGSAAGNRTSTLSMGQVDYTIDDGQRCGMESASLRMDDGTARSTTV